MEGRKGAILTKRPAAGHARRAQSAQTDGLERRPDARRSERTVCQLRIVINSGWAIAFHKKVY